VRSKELAMTVRNSEVDGYMRKLEPERRAALARLRWLIIDTVPATTESMKYKMPTYAYRDAVLCAIASQKHYMSLYVEPRVLDRHREELHHLSLGKSCIRFKSIEQLPLDTVRRILSETVQALNADRDQSGNVSGE
jgi:uncharacterized protein YdhG (YjbR/CyaY superfamily)